MMATYEVPRIEGETNWQWCQRYAEAYDKDVLIGELVMALMRARNVEAWVAIKDATNLGSGIGGALAARFGFED